MEYGQAGSVVVADGDRHVPVMRNGLYSQFCKTAWKPYDLAVTAFLIISEHHLGEGLLVMSDGTQEAWAPSATLCQRVLAYDQDFILDPK